MDILASYRLWLTQRGNKPGTVNMVIAIMRRIMRDVSPITKDAASEFLLKMHSEGRKPSYLNIFIRVFALWGEFTGDDSLKEIKEFKRTPVLKSTFSDQEIEEFLSLPMEVCRVRNKSGKESVRRTDPRGHRMFTVFWTIMAYSGMRCGEVAKLRIEDVDFSRGVYILLDTKTNDSRYVPIADHVKPLIESYIKEIPGPYLFPSRRGGMKGGPVIDNVDWHYNFHRRLKRLGIKRNRLTPYSFRHSFITSLLPESNLFDTMEIVGHRRADTTRQYYHKNIQTMKRALEKLPLNLKTPFDKIRVLREILLGMRLNPNEFNLEMTNGRILVEVIEN